MDKIVQKKHQQKHSGKIVLVKFIIKSIVSLLLFISCVLYILYISKIYNIYKY